MPKFVSSLQRFTQPPSCLCTLVFAVAIVTTASATPALRRVTKTGLSTAATTAATTAETTVATKRTCETITTIAPVMQNLELEGHWHEVPSHCFVQYAKKFAPTTLSAAKITISVAAVNGKVDVTIGTRSSNVREIYEKREHIESATTNVVVELSAGQTVYIGIKRSSPDTKCQLKYTTDHFDQLIAKGRVSSWDFLSNDTFLVGFIVGMTALLSVAFMVSIIACGCAIVKARKKTKGGKKKKKKSKQPESPRSPRAPKSPKVLRQTSIGDSLDW